MRVLITGCAGFIGSHLADRCIAEGWSVTGVDDLSGGRMAWVNDACDIYTMDFACDEALALVKQGGFDSVFHLAATPRVSYSVEHPLETHRNNVTRSLALIDACRGNVGRFVFASSSSVYGGADSMPTSEGERKKPKSPYALQKSQVEDYLRLYRNLYGLDAVSLRFFNVFGPRQLGDSPYSTAVSAWLTAIKRGRPMRSDGDGSQTRDLCYVSNVVDACVLASQAEARLLRTFDTFNVACDDATSNADILQHLLARYPGSTTCSAPWRVGDVMHTRADIILASLIGYEPKVRFWEGLDLTCKWYDAEWDAIKGMGANACSNTTR